MIHYFKNKDEQSFTVCGETNYQVLKKNKAWIEITEEEYNKIFEEPKTEEKGDE